MTKDRASRFRQKVYWPDRAIVQRTVAQIRLLLEIEVELSGLENGK